MIAQVDAAALADARADREVANRKVESLQMTLAALKDDHERLKGAEASLKNARANLKDREEKLRAMSKQLEAARCALTSFKLCELRMECLGTLLMHEPCLLTLLASAGFKARFGLLTSFIPVALQDGD